jgi:HlyD family secretion protein
LSVSLFSLRRFIDLTKSSNFNWTCYNDAKRVYDMICEIIWKDIISRNDWNLIKESLRFQEERKSNIRTSIQRRNRPIRYRFRRLIVRSKRWKFGYSKVIKNFLITAVSGRLTSFEPILGKTFQAGESIGRIDSHEGYKLSAQVDEFYLEKIRAGLKGQIE